MKMRHGTAEVQNAGRFHICWRRHCRREQMICDHVWERGVDGRSVSVGASDRPSQITIDLGGGGDDDDAHGTYGDVAINEIRRRVSSPSRETAAAAAAAASHRAPDDDRHRHRRRRRQIYGRTVDRSTGRPAPIRPGERWTQSARLQSVTGRLLYVCPGSLPITSHVSR